jgi:hypothetical protein
MFSYTLGMTLSWLLSWEVHTGLLLPAVLASCLHLFLYARVLLSPSIMQFADFLGCCLWSVSVRWELCSLVLLALRTEPETKQLFIT